MEKERERDGDRMKGGTRITSGREKEKEGEMAEKKHYKTNTGRKILLLLLLLRDVRYSIQGFCQFSRAIGGEGPTAPTAPILHTNAHTSKHTQSLSPVPLLVLFLYRLDEYFITSNINIHSNGFAHSYYRYFLFLYFKQKYSLQILHNQALK